MRLSGHRRRIRGLAYALPMTFNLTQANTSVFRTQYRAATRNTIIAVIGDSTDRGLSTGNGFGQALDAWPMQVAIKLRAASIPAGANNLWGEGGSWGLAGTITNFASGDSRFTFTGAAALGSVKCAGGNAFTASAAGSMTITFQDAIDTFEIYDRDGTIGRNWSYQIDGGSVVAVNSTSTAQIRKTSIALGSVASHAVTINWVAGSPFWMGFNGFNSTRKEISLWNWGVSGLPSSGYLDDTDAIASRLKMLNVLNPDLTIVSMTGNDWRTSVSVATAQANVQAVISNRLTAGKNVIVRTIPWDGSNTGLVANQEQYTLAGYQLASSNNIPMFNIRKKAPNWLSYAAEQAASFVSDTVHPTPAGYIDEATTIASLIQSIT